jgi:hypothetical protein
MVGGQDEPPSQIDPAGLAGWTPQKADPTAALRRHRHEIESGGELAVTYRDVLVSRLGQTSGVRATGEDIWGKAFNIRGAGADMMGDLWARMY